VNPMTIACPDCSAAAVIDITASGLVHAQLQHDATCPRLNHPAFGLHNDH
jgi:hypothetical protein